MWIVLFEVSEELGVGELLQAGGVVSHNVPSSWEEEHALAVAVAASMEARQVAEVRGWPVAGYGAFGAPARIA